MFAINSGVIVIPDAFHPSITIMVGIFFLGGGTLEDAEPVFVLF
ncbi:MAG: hypothetical protein WCX22_01415 [Methanoregula sp.]